MPMKDKNQKSDSMKTIVKIAVALLMLIVVALLMGFPVMWLWNYLMPNIFGLKQITFYQAIGINILCGILFKDGSSSKSSD